MKCPICGNDVKPGKKYCSTTCWQTYQKIKFKRPAIRDREPGEWVRDVDRLVERLGGKPKTKLTTESVAEARRLAANGTPLSELAERYGVTSQTMQQAIEGDTWRDVMVAPVALPSSQKRLTPAQRLEVFRLYNDTKTHINDIAAQFGVHPGTIHQIVAAMRRRR